VEVWRYGDCYLGCSKATINNAVCYVNGTVATKKTSLCTFRLSSATRFHSRKIKISWDPLENTQDVYLHSLLIKLGLIKNFVKALTERDNLSLFWEKISPNLVRLKWKSEFCCPSDTGGYKRTGFRSNLDCTEKAAWNTFKSECTKSIGIHKAENHREIFSEMSNCFQVMKCNMLLRLHFLDSHLEFFPKIMGDFSDEHGEISVRYFRHGKMSLWNACRILLD
jgi:hypothetical protein